MMPQISHQEDMSCPCDLKVSCKSFVFKSDFLKKLLSSNLSKSRNNFDVAEKRKNVALQRCIMPYIKRTFTFIIHVYIPHISEVAEI